MECRLLCQPLNSMPLLKSAFITISLARICSAMRRSRHGGKAPPRQAALVDLLDALASAIPQAKKRPQRGGELRPWKVLHRECAERQERHVHVIRCRENRSKQGPNSSGWLSSKAASVGDIDKNQWALPFDDYRRQSILPSGLEGGPFRFMSGVRIRPSPDSASAGGLFPVRPWHHVPPCGTTCAQVPTFILVSGRNKSPCCRVVRY